MEIAIDSNNAILIADSGNHRIRAVKDAAVETLAGDGVDGFRDGDAKEARFYWPRGVTIDSDNNIIVADTYNHLIRKIATDGVTTIAGCQVGQLYGGYVDGEGEQAQFSYPTGVDVDDNGDIVVVDRDNRCVRRVSTDGVVSTACRSVNEESMLNKPAGIAIDCNRNIIIADVYNHRICQLAAEW